MQLKLQRSQRAGGLAASTIFFCLDVRADYTSEERTNINRYKLGGQTIYNSRAARKHLETAGAHLDRTQEGTAGSRALALARGAASMALAKMQLTISIASLGRGHHIECKDLEELLESEDTIRTACKNLTRYLEIADTFDGSEVVVEYVNGEERVHISHEATPLLEYSGGEASPAAVSYTTHDPSAPAMDIGRELGMWVRRLWDRLGQSGNGPRYFVVGSGVVILFLLLRACSG
jgi:hypothetical protein